MPDITDVAGFTIGSWTGAGTGVTVVVCPPGTVGSAELRGGAPATRETALLAPGSAMGQIDAVVLSGGSAFGLAAADGVVGWLAEHGRGFDIRGGPVPIVPAAAIFDLVASGGERPDADAGRAAMEAAARGDRFATGRVGAGRGATIGKWRGPEHAVPGGIGSASRRVDDATIGALAVVNALGDVVGSDGSVLAGSAAPADVGGFPIESFPAGAGLGADERGGGNTTLVVLATDAVCSKSDCHLLAQAGNHGLAHAVHPSHTRYDGDLVIALATGTVAVHLDRLRMAATEVVAEAVRDAVRQT